MGKVTQVRLTTFKGDTWLETFLAKFQNMSKYYRWDEHDNLFFLQAHLDGAAAQILWFGEELTTYEEVIKLLRTRLARIIKQNGSELN